MQHINAASCQQGSVEGSRPNPKNLDEARGKSHQSADKFAEGPGTSSADSVKALNSFSVAEVAVVADVPLCVNCWAHAEFVCSECELRELVGQMLDAAYSSASCPARKSRRRLFAQIKQMLSAGLEERVRNEVSPTLLGDQLCLEA